MEMRVKLVKLAGKAHLLADEQGSLRIPDSIPKTEDSSHSGNNDSSNKNVTTKPKAAKPKTKTMKTKPKTTRKATRQESSRTFHPKTTSRELGMENLLKYAVNEFIVDHENCSKCGKEANETPWVITEVSGKSIPLRHVSNLRLDCFSVSVRPSILLRVPFQDLEKRS